MKIENVTVEDAKELLEIYAPYVLDTAISFEYEVPSVEEFTKRIETISAKYPYLKAVDDGQIVGYAYAAPFKGRAAYDWAVETTIYVRRDCRRSGVGAALYEALEHLLREMHITNMNACIAYLDEEDEHLTMDSILFHQKMGFEMVGRFHQIGYKFNSWYDMAWMEKMLAEHEKEMRPVQYEKRHHL